MDGGANGFAKAASSARASSSKLANGSSFATTEVAALEEGFFCASSALASSSANGSFRFTVEPEAILLYPSIFSKHLVRCF
jgi:hypothetical protein